MHMTLFDVKEQEALAADGGRDGNRGEVRGEQPPTINRRKSTLASLNLEIRCSWMAVANSLLF